MRKAPVFCLLQGCDDRLHGVDVKINGYISASAVGQYAIAGGHSVVRTEVGLSVGDTFS